jgi:N-acetyl-gamma-glutamyl-phosphate reductase
VESVLLSTRERVSGAGRAPKPNTTFCADLTAYGLLRHRHTPEMEQPGQGRRVARRVSRWFTRTPDEPRQLATCYVPVVDVDRCLLSASTSSTPMSPFVVVTEGSPSTKATLGANTAHVTVRHDERTGYAIAICAIDNLAKGA